MIQRFSDKQVAIIKALGLYKFLTYEQMKRLGIDNHSSNLSSNLKLLRESRKPLVKKIPHRVGAPVKHYLSPFGRKVLVEHFNIKEDKVHSPKGTILTDTQDQKHRTQIIDLHIELNRYSQENDIEVLLVERYFDKTGSAKEKSLKSKTAFIFEGKKTVKVDFVFMIKTPIQKELYLLEMENGKDAKKAVEKCIDFGKLLLQDSVNNKYNFDQGYRSLWVFEYTSTMTATITKLQTIPFFNNMREYFLFKTIDGVKENYFDKWTNLDGETRKLYYI